MIKDKTRLLLITLILTLVIIAYRAGFFSNFYDVKGFVAFMQQAGPWLYVAYIGMYIVGGIFVFPGSVLGVSGGLLFGPVIGVVMSVIGATLSATTSFMISRYVARDFFEDNLQKIPLYQKIEEKTDTFGIEFLILIRLTPGVAFSIKNYICGLTRLRNVEYIVGSFLMMIPSCIMYAFPAGEMSHDGLSWATAKAMGVAMACNLVLYMMYKRSLGSPKETR